MTEEDHKYILDDISFVTLRESLTVTCGKVGVGKSTLLSAISGGIVVTSGTVGYPGSLTFFPVSSGCFLEL